MHATLRLFLKQTVVYLNVLIPIVEIRLSQKKIFGDITPTLQI